MMMIGAYGVFLIVALVLCLKVRSDLKRHGDLLVENQDDRYGERRLRSVIRLTMLGFNLFTAGVVALLLLRIGLAPQSAVDALVFLAVRIGILLLVLGGAYFRCLSVMTRALAMPAETVRAGPPGRTRPRRAKEDPLDRVFDAARFELQSGG